MTEPTLWAFGHAEILPTAAATSEAPTQAYPAVVPKEV